MMRLGNISPQRAQNHSEVSDKHRVMTRSASQQISLLLSHFMEVRNNVILPTITTR